MADATTLFNVLKRELPDLGPARRAELHQTILRVCNGIDARETTFALSDAALDAGVSAWFGVTKVEAEKNFIRSRMRAAVLAVLTHERAQPDASIVWRDMATAPKDGTLVRLLVEFEHHATEDGEGPQPTIGSNTYDNHRDFDEWQFAGWSWEHDCYTQGVGKPIGWLPMLNDTPCEATTDGGGAR